MASKYGNYGYGIDLGTTNSCIARANKKGEVEVIKNSEGDYLTPSIIEFESSTKIIVGEVAKESVRLNPNNVIQNIKSHMGRDDFCHTCQGVKFTPVDISAEILKKLVHDAEQAVHEKIRDVIITVPAYFGEAARNDTMEAAKKAGLNVIEIMNEPTAAALAYSNKFADMDNKVVLVYDLGGGTFDVTVAEIIGGRVEVVCKDGNRDLGGKHWDEDLENYVISEFCAKTGATTNEVLNNAQCYNEIGLKVEEAKKRLSLKDSTKIVVSLREKVAEIEITKEKFNELTRGRLLNTINLINKVLESAEQKTSSKGKACDKLDEIILVGGSTRMTQISDEIFKVFDIKPVIFEQDLAVAMGAALFAAGYEKIVEVASKSYGVQALDEDNILKLTNIIIKDQKIPCSKTKTFGTGYEDQRIINVVIYESDSKTAKHDLDADDVKELKRSDLRLPPELPEDSPIDVTFSINASGILNVVAVERTSGKKCEIQTKLNRV
jgi:molecular chaperone DnaK (HSP70)